MSASVADWPRSHFTAKGGVPTLFYVVFAGDVSIPPISASRYRCTGVPDGVQIGKFGPDAHPERLDSFRSGYLWDELKSKAPALADTVARQKYCFIVYGELEDGPTLNDFRNVIGLLTCMLDAGGVCIYDPFMFRWWSPEEWRKRVFDPAAPSPRTHVVILISAEDDGTEWFHTRGLRKFGRPDLSIHHVPASHRDAIIDLFERFIELQALGGVIEEGQDIRMQSLPEGMRCFHGGDLDDPDFNNVHVELRWPQGEPRTNSPSTAQWIAPTQAQVDASRVMAEAILAALTNERGVHADTAVVCAARIAGTFLFRSFDLPVRDAKPGTPVLSEAANEHGPLLIQTLGAVLARANITIDSTKASDPIPEEHQPHLSLAQTQTVMEPALRRIAEKHGLSNEQAAHACAIATGALIQKASGALDPTLAFGLAVYGFIEGSKTMPVPLDDATSPPPKSWLKFWQ